jgi:hypothetical protein
MKNDLQLESSNQSQPNLEISFTQNRKQGKVSWLAIVFSQMKKISYKHREQLKQEEQQAIVQAEYQEQLNIRVQKEKNDADQKVKEEHKIRAGQFLQSELYEYYFAMVKNGYEPTSSQGTKIYEKMIGIVETNSMKKSIEILDKYIEQGYNLQPGVLVHMLNLKMDRSIINKEMLVEKPVLENAPNFSAELYRLMKGNDVVNVLYQDFKEKHISIPAMNFNASHMALDKKGNARPFAYYLNKNLEKMSHIINYAYLCEQAPEIFLKNVDLGSYLDSYNLLIEDKKHLENIWNNQAVGTVSANERVELDKKYGEYLSLEMNGGRWEVEMSMSLMADWHEALQIFKEKILDGYYKTQIDQHLQTTKLVYAKDYVEEIQANKLTNQIQSYNIKDLPQKAQDVLNEISLLSLKIEKSYDKQNLQMQFEVDNLLNKRVPEALVKYMSIDSEYRQSLKNHSGKSAEDLMLETLENYQQKLDTIYVQCNENRLSDLSAINRYSHKIK